MDISDKSRKILWARSGNRCAICKQELVIGETPNDNDSVVGDECHIISGTKGGPRYDPSYSTEKLDALENLILLCRVHHKMIDDQCDTYTADILRKIKANHENWVSLRLSGKADSKPVTIKRVKQNIPKHLVRLNTGEEIVNLVVNAYVLYTNHDHLESELQVKTISEFFQVVQDFLDTANDFGPSYHVEMAFVMSSFVKRLETLGFWVFGAKEMQIIDGGVSGPSNWPVAYIHILGSDNKVIEVLDEASVPKNDI
jgi:hypothetical protein